MLVSASVPQKASKFGLGRGARLRIIKYIYNQKRPLTAWHVCCCSHILWCHQCLSLTSHHPIHAWHYLFIKKRYGRKRGRISGEDSEKKDNVQTESEIGRNLCGARTNLKRSRRGYLVLNMSRCWWCGWIVGWVDGWVDGYIDVDKNMQMRDRERDTHTRIMM